MDLKTDARTYRYGFNGMESDEEVKGKGNSYTTEFRQYDPRVGRWLSLDPLMNIFAAESPYSAFANNPIFFTDPYGLAPSNDGGPEKVVVQSGDFKEDNKKDRESLPEVAENGQVVRFEYVTDENSHITAEEFKFDAESGKWGSAVIWDDGTTSETGNFWYEGTASSMPENEQSESLDDQVIAKQNSTSVEAKLKAQTAKNTSSVTTEALSDVSTGNGIAGATTTLAEQIAHDAATQTPKYKSKTIPDKKTWTKVKSGYTKAKNGLKTLGKILGVTDILVNGAEAVNHFKNGDVGKGIKSSIKAVGSTILMVIKNNPVVRAANVLWTIGNLFW